jgi:hypothetical protein
MTLTMEGIYTQGKIELLETPVGVREGRVRVVLTQEETSPRHLVRGKYKTGRFSTLEDFAEAEWRGDQEAVNKHGE